MKEDLSIWPFERQSTAVEDGLLWLNTGTVQQNSPQGDEFYNSIIFVLVCHAPRKERGQWCITSLIAQ
jgi:hypothetical protein